MPLPPLSESEWTPVPKYEDLYEIHPTGLVRRSAGGKGTRAGTILKWSDDGHGYPKVNLCRDGKPRRYKVHRLVAAAFLGPQPEGHEVNHKDGVRWNPHAGNLEYVTRRENHLHAYRKLGRGTSSQMTEMMVRVMKRLRFDLGWSCREVSEAFPVSTETVRRFTAGIRSAR